MQFEDFERAAFVNQAFQAMWSFLDASMCTAIREFIEPVIQAQLPFPISGFEFEKLAFGDTPWQVRGVKHYSLYAGTPRMDACVQMARKEAAPTGLTWMSAIACARAREALLHIS